MLKPLIGMFAICLCIFLMSCANGAPTLLKSSSEIVGETASSQRTFYCDQLQPTPIPGTSQQYVLSLLPGRMNGETDIGYRERLSSDLERGIFDWWINETRDATKYHAICKA